MKFLIHERKSIETAIAAKGLDLSEFEFVKRKGRMHITHIKTKESFIYFRRKTSNLVEGNRFELSQIYEVYLEGQMIPFEDWNEVNEVFDKWLVKSIKV